MYAAIAHQINRGGVSQSVQQLRNLAADFMRSNIDDFMPFMDEVENEEQYVKYCDDIQRTAAWGSQLEVSSIHSSWPLLSERSVWIFLNLSSKEKISIDDSLEWDGASNLGLVRKSRRRWMVETNLHLCWCVFSLLHSFFHLLFSFWFSLAPCGNSAPQLRALSQVLRRPFEVVQAEGRPVVIGEEFLDSSSTPVLLTYHRHMYGLGEHYNSVQTRPPAEDGDDQDHPQ